MNKVKGSFFRASMASMMMTSAGSGFFATHTVDEWLWGYEDRLLARVAASSPDVDKVFGLMYKARTWPQIIKADAPQIMFIADENSKIYCSPFDE